MATKIFVNLPVKDLARSQQFFTSLGYAVNSQFTNENAACIVISDDIYAMLLTEPFFQTFTDKQVADAHSTAEVMLALSVDTRQEVEEFLQKALAAGATEPRPPQDHGFMYGRDFDDPDGHTWEIFWMNESAVT